MTLLAKDIMVKSFDKINENASVGTAIDMILNGRVRETGHKTISLMVTNDFNQYVGVVTMFDVLYHLRPAFLNHGVDGEHFTWDGQLVQFTRELREKDVRQIMSSEVVGALAEEHIMVVLDRMIKNRYRRLPVLDGGQPVGIIYISDIYHHLFK